MSAIQSSVGLITGIPIQDTVDQLIAVSSRPRNLLSQRNQGLQSERAAIDRLSSLTLSTKFSLNKLNLARTFTARAASSSNETAVSARVQTGASPVAASYQFTPLKLASSHQLVSSRIDDVADLGSGSLSFGYGGHVDRGVSLDDLNGGEGFDAGKIKITDRAGQTAVIDLRGAQTIDDVIESINEASELDVVASADGDRLVITDNSGETGTLRVREVDGGTTAASLGIAQTAAGDTLTGTDIYRLGEETELASLNDGLGVRITQASDRESTEGINEAADLSITLRDGTTAEIDLSGLDTLGEVIDAINTNAGLDGGLTASFNADQNGLVLTDSTGGSGNLIVQDLEDSTAATDLGIATAAEGVASATLDGQRLISGLKDTLISNLNAGAGVDLTGASIDITDRSGTTVAGIDLSNAETIGEVIQAINDSASTVEARINDARNGIVLTDTTGGSGSLVVADASGSTAAADLGLTIDSATNSADGGSLSRRSVSKATRLEDFNGGVSIGDIKITDSSGSSSTIQIQDTDNDAETLGDVIDRINASGLGAKGSITARINDAGDGILITDNAGGTGTLKVEEVGSGKTAEELGLLGDSTATDENGAQIINGTTSFSVDLSDLENSARATSLASLNDGEGIDLGIFEVSTASGESFAVDLGKGTADAQTIGDVIDRINESATAAGLDVTASLNENQSGIVITDNTTGDGEFAVTDRGSDKTAEQLLLTGEADGNEIAGPGLFTFNGDNALQTLAERINDLGAGVTASVFNDGAGFRLSLTADRPGAGNELLVDGLASQLSFTETSRPSDAVALFGGVGGIGGFAVTSKTNEFSEVIDGVTLTANQASGEAVSVDLVSDDQPVVDALQDFVDAYNSLRSNLDQTTDFDAESATTGILFGRSEVLQVDTQLSRLVTDRYFIDGEATTLASIGLSVDEEGKLALDTGRLRDALAEDPEQVESLFRDEDRGVVARLTAAIDSLAGDENSLLSRRSDALTRTIDDNATRIEALNASLERQRDRLLLDFFRLEETIGNLQSNTSFLDSIQAITIANSST